MATRPIRNCLMSYAFVPCRFQTSCTYTNQRIRHPSCQADRRSDGHPDRTVTSSRKTHCDRAPGILRTFRSDRSHDLTDSSRRHHMNNLAKNEISVVYFWEAVFTSEQYTIHEITADIQLPKEEKQHESVSQNDTSGSQI